MSRFSDYLASAITPQMTLLEKFNALCKFLKENNYISIFYSSENYNPNTRDYQISNVSVLNYELKLGDCVVFSNGYYAFVETLGENTFTIGNILYFQGEQGVSVVSATINNTGNLILTLSNGTTVNAGNTGAVKDFIIDENQHLIVRYLNGTTNDLGSIFNGNITISGNITATGTIDGNLITGNEIVEKMTNYSFTPSSSLTNVTIENIYCGIVKNGNKLTFVYAFNLTKGADAVNQGGLGYIGIPNSVGAKLYPTRIGTYDYLANGKINASNLPNASVDVHYAIAKNSNNSLALFIYNLNELTEGTKYYCRIEQTFLLSDNLIS